jgi:hypothetical protein
MSLVTPAERAAFESPVLFFRPESSFSPSFWPKSYRAADRLADEQLSDLV